MRIRRLAIAGLAALTAVPALFVATANPVKAAAAGPYSGSADADLVHLNAVNIPGALDPGLADAHLAPSTAQVNSAGLAAPYAGKRSAARATNLDASLVGGAIPLTLITEAEQTAPPNNSQPAVDSLTGPVDLSPIAKLELANTQAQARWGSSDTTCVPPGTPIATSKATVADANVLPLGGPIGDGLVSVVNGNGGAVYTTSDVGIVDVAGQTPKGLRSHALDQVTGVVLFKGTPNELTLNVVAPPELQATATGKGSTSTVTYSEPVVQVVQGGNVTNVLDATDANVDIQIPPGGTPLMILRLELGTLANVVKTDTQASGTSKLLGVTLLDATGQLTLAKLDVAPMAVKATVPAGGITCGAGPLSNIQVDASTPTVLPNGSFEYAVTIPNIGECTVKAVKVVLTVTGPAGSAISGTSPTANKVEGLTATWDNIGDIAPGALKVVKATVKVPSGATPGTSYVGTATASGTCDNSPTSATASSGPVPSVGAPSATACDLSASGISSSHREVRIGDYFNEYVRLTNLGKGTCNSITVTVNYPPDTSFVTCTDNCTHNDATRKVTWTVPSLGSGISKDLVATFKVNTSAKPGENLGTSVTIKSGRQTVTDSSKLPVVSGNNVLNSGAQRSRGLLPRTGADAPLGIAFGLMSLFVVARGLRRRFGLGA